MTDVPALLNAPGRLVTVRFSDRRCTVVAESALDARERAPITDVMHLELVSGSGEQPGWPRPVQTHAVVESGRDAIRTIHRATRWASYAARVAVVPGDRLSEIALMEAQLRGVWVVAAERVPHVAVYGERGPARGSARGLLHRLFDELIWAELSGDRITSRSVSTSPSCAAPPA